MQSPSRICVIAEGQLGDLLILSPALRALKESFPGSTLTVLVLQRRFYEGAGGSAATVLRESPGKGTSAVLRSDPHVDCVAEIDRDALRSLKGVRRIAAEWSIVRWLRKGHFDAVLCTFPQDRFFLWAFLAGARIRVGEGGKGLSFLLSRRMRKTKSSEGVLAYYCGLAEAAGAVVKSRRTAVDIPGVHAERASAHWNSLGFTEKSAVVGVHPGASGEYRIWPPGKYAALIDHVQARGLSVVLLGSEFDREVLEEVRNACSSAPGLIVTADVMDLGAILRKCVLLVSNNSGPRHLAVAAGVPSLALIPQFDDVLWKIYTDEKKAGTMQSTGTCPLCPPGECRNIIPPGERYGSWCMRALGVEEVSARMDDLLALPGGRSLPS